MQPTGLAKLLDAFSGRFELRGRLGFGGMGVVHRAFDQELGREVALKTLRTTDPTLLYSLKQEFRAAANLNHPNLVQLHELFVVDNQCFFSMELVEGVTFTHFVRQGWVAARAPSVAPDGASDSERSASRQSGVVNVQGAWSTPLPALGDLDAGARLALATTQLVTAVAALHAAGRIHCDIKPSNILVTEAGRVVLLDFGLSSPLGGQPSKTEFAGTLAYAAPEQLWGEALTPATDWYAVGGVLFEAVTGCLPGVDGRRVFAQHVDLQSPVEPALLDTIGALLEHNPSQRPAADVILASLAQPYASASRDPGLVGRAAEQRVLQLALQTAASGWLTAVDVQGESGIGKTELVRQFALQAEREAALVARAQCRLRESVSHQALDQIIDDLSTYLMELPDPELSSLLPEPFDSLVRLFPVLGRVRSSERSAAQVDPAVVREQATEALRQLLWRIGAERPVLFWIDDAHWGDAESQRLLCELLRPPAPPLLLILSHRDASAPWVTAVREVVVQSHGQWILLALAPLGLDSSERLVHQLLGSAASQGELATRVAAESEGLPLFLGQLCQMITETADRDQTADLLKLTLREVVARRVDELSEPERRIVELAALVSAPLPVSVLLAAAGSPPGGRLLVSQLSAAQLLQLSGARAEPRVASFHQRVRELILAGLGAAPQRAGHQLLLDAVERLGNELEPETLLHHLIGAGAREQALALARSAAQAAIRRLAFAHAAGLYETALGLSRGLGKEDAALQESLADALAAAGQAGAAGEQYLALAERAPAPETLRLLQRAAENFLVGGLFERGVGVLRRALVTARLRVPASRPVAVLQALTQLASFWLRSRLRARVPRGSAAALDRARAELCLSAAKGFGAVDPMWSAQYAFLALNLAERAGHAATKGSALCLAGMILAVAPGRIGALGGAWLDEAERIADDEPALLCLVDVCRAQGSLTVGHWSAALAQCERALRQSALHRDATTWERNMSQMTSIRALEELGELKRAWARAAEWLSDARLRGDLYAETTARLYLAFAELASDRPEQTEHLATVSLQRWTERAPPFQEFYRLRALAYAQLYRGAASAALELAERADRTLRDAQLQHFPMAVLEICLLRSRIYLRLCAANTPAAAQHAQDCERQLQRLERLRRADSTAHAALLRAGLERLSGRQTRARELLAAARSHFQQCQMTLGCAYVAEAENALDSASATASRLLESSALLRAQGILRPQRWLEMHGVLLNPEAPGDAEGGQAAFNRGDFLAGTQAVA